MQHVDAVGVGRARGLECALGARDVALEQQNLRGAKLRQLGARVEPRRLVQQVLAGRQFAELEPRDPQRRPHQRLRLRVARSGLDVGDEKAQFALQQHRLGQNRRHVVVVRAGALGVARLDLCGRRVAKRQIDAGELDPEVPVARVERGSPAQPRERPRRSPAASSWIAADRSSW